ncbi:MAG: hypothetical protein IJJ15_02635 [Ruminococcus sp.]|nr:hypothetical protein [Ruminococcus sp.]
MTKRIISVCTAVMLIIVMCISVSFTAFSAEEVSYIIQADKSSAAVGDTIYYTVSLGKCSHVQSTQVTLDIPEGLSYIEGKAADGIDDTLGAAMAQYADEGRTFASFGLGDYSSDKETLLFTFSCKVAETAEGGKTYTIGVKQLVTGDPDDEDIPCVWNSDNAAVTVSGSGSSGGTGSSGKEDSSDGTGSSNGAGDASSPAENGSGSQDVSPDGGTDAKAQEQTDEDGNVIMLRPADSESSTATSDSATTDQATGGISPWIFVVIGVAAAIAAFIAIYFFMEYKKRKKENHNG